MDSKLKKTLAVNEKQREFYNQPQKSLASRIWSAVRNGVLNDFRDQFDIKSRVYEEHKRWLGDLSAKKVLDLGCLRGNHLSFYMARNAKQYIGIDLSDKAIGILSKKLTPDQYPNASAMAIDFLSPEFTEKDFDVIYAYGVLHHFEDFGLLLDRMESKLSANGRVICYDPLQTSPPLKLARALYRPFQTDKHWEWPFTKETLKTIESRFRILDIHGIMGASKWGIALNLLPLSKGYVQKKVQDWIEQDWASQGIDRKLYRCLHVTIHFERHQFMME